MEPLKSFKEVVLSFLQGADSFLASTYTLDVCGFRLLDALAKKNGVKGLIIAHDLRDWPWDLDNTHVKIKAINEVWNQQRKIRSTIIEDPIFHAKVYLALNGQRIKALITSGNLTFRALNKSIEVYGILEAKLSESCPMAEYMNMLIEGSVTSLHNILPKLKDQCLPEKDEDTELKAILSVVEFFGSLMFPPTHELRSLGIKNSPFFYNRGSQKAVADAITQAIKIMKPSGDPLEVFLVSPYITREGVLEVLRIIKNSLVAEGVWPIKIKLRLLTQELQNEKEDNRDEKICVLATPKQLLDKLRNFPFVDFSDHDFKVWRSNYRVEFSKRTEIKGFLHAKAIFLKQRRPLNVVAIIGSPNISLQALGPHPMRNIEAALLITGEEASELFKTFNTLFKETPHIETQKLTELRIPYGLHDKLSKVNIGIRIRDKYINLDRLYKTTELPYLAELDELNIIVEIPERNQFNDLSVECDIKELSHNTRYSVKDFNMRVEGRAFVFSNNRVRIKLPANISLKLKLHEETYYGRSIDLLLPHPVERGSVRIHEINGKIFLIFMASPNSEFDGIELSLPANNLAVTLPEIWYLTRDRNSGQMEPVPLIGSRDIVLIKMYASNDDKIAYLIGPLEGVSKHRDLTDIYIMDKYYSRRSSIIFTPKELRSKKGAEVVEELYSYYKEVDRNLLNEILPRVSRAIREFGYHGLETSIIINKAYRSIGAWKMIKDSIGVYCFPKNGCHSLNKLSSAMLNKELEHLTLDVGDIEKNCRTKVVGDFSEVETYIIHYGKLASSENGKDLFADMIILKHEIMKYKVNNDLEDFLKQVFSRTKYLKRLVKRLLSTLPRHVKSELIKHEIKTTESFEATNLSTYIIKSIIGCDNLLRILRPIIGIRFCTPNVVTNKLLESGVLFKYGNHYCISNEFMGGKESIIRSILVSLRETIDKYFAEIEDEDRELKICLKPYVMQMLEDLINDIVFAECGEEGGLSLEPLIRFLTSGS